MTCSLNNLRHELESLQVLADNMTNRENERNKEMLNMSKAYKEGQEAFFQGMQKNRNPHLNKKDVISVAMCLGWNNGYEDAKIESSGV